jgi:cytochrome c oxidase subunit 2
MEMIQTVAWVTSFIFIILIGIVFGWVALHSTKKEAYEPIVKKWYKARKVYGIILVTLMVIMSIYTLRDLPYNEPVYSRGVEPVLVDAEALQFGWNISQTEFEVGDSIEFRVTTADVTHGFGIYNPEMVLLAQTQAMPEYTNNLYITFNEPGSYEILCLEYCGLGHHLMTATLEVK